MSFDISQLVNNLSPVTLALASSSDLTQSDQQLLEAIQNKRRTFTDGEVLICDGDPIEMCLFLLDGWLARQRNTPDGQLVTTNVYLPGDIVSMHLGFKRFAHFDTVALTNGEVAVVESSRLRALVTKHAVIDAALDWSAVRAFNIVSEHVVGNSARPSSERLLHLLSELWCRLVVVGQASAQSFYLPMSQSELGNLASLSVVSVNRAIQSLKKIGLITQANRTVTFQDIRKCIS